MSSMRMYLATQILNFADSDSVSMVGLFKYSIIRLLQLRVLIVITSPVSILGRLTTSTEIPLIALELVGSTRESSYAFEFSYRGIYIN